MTARSHVGVPQPRLPFEPLRRAVESRMVKSAWNPTGNSVTGAGMLSSLGWSYNSWQAKTWQKYRTLGEIPVMAADRMACAMGLHPAEIWGEDWWAADALGLPDDEVSLMTLADRLRARGVPLAQMPAEVQERVREQWRRNAQRRRERSTA